MGSFFKPAPPPPVLRQPIVQAPPPAPVEDNVDDRSGEDLSRARRGAAAVARRRSPTLLSGAVSGTQKRLLGE